MPVLLLLIHSSFSGIQSLWRGVSGRPLLSSIHRSDPSKSLNTLSASTWIQVGARCLSRLCLPKGSELMDALCRDRKHLCEWIFVGSKKWGVNKQNSVWLAFSDQTFHHLVCIQCHCWKLLKNLSLRQQSLYKGGTLQPARICSLINSAFLFHNHQQKIMTVFIERSD